MPLCVVMYTQILNHFNEIWYVIARGTDIRLDRESSAERSMPLCVVMYTHILYHFNEIGMGLLGVQTFV